MLICLFIIIVVVILVNNRQNIYSKNMFYMDTYINVKVYSNNKSKATRALAEVNNIYRKYHNLTDKYNEYSRVINVYTLNNTNNKKIKIAKELYDVIKYGKDAYEKTNGLINIGLGNAIDVWKDYRDSEKGVPTYSQLSNLGSNNVSDIVLYDNNYIELKNGVKIDLGAISKGYTTELVGKYLESVKLNKYLINAGGNVKVGDHYQNNKYNIGIMKPKKNSSDVFKVVKGNNISVVTSGSYERYYEYNGNRYHHIIDPITLYPPNYMLSVTIITRDSALADVLSTTLFLMNIEDGIKYINNLDNVEALWYSDSGKVYYSDGIKKYE
jgi:FAD:protein FMN transferase